MNLPELQQLFRSFADVQTAEMLNLPRPAVETGKPIVVACPMSDVQHAIQDTLVERYERLRNSKVDPREDNALAITTDGRKLALDGRMLDSQATDFPESKINALAENVAAIWKRTEPTRGTQMIFCDMGVNPTGPGGFSAYDEVVRKLLERGIPRQQIASIGDADSDAKKLALFEKVRQGTVRVLIGSTMKMGTGTNVQKRLVALHHLDAPWKPAEVEQREGRILRQGNENKEVAIYRYVTTGSFDSYMWQALETKARFISQIMAGDGVGRKAEDIGGQELSYAEVKAIASGNPAVLTLAEADAELQRLNLLRRGHSDEQYLARRRLRELPDAIESQKKRLANLEADEQTVADHAEDRIVIGKQAYSRDDAQAVLGERLEGVRSVLGETRRVALGVYKGLRFGIVLHPQYAPEAYLEGAATRQTMLSREHHGPRAVLNGLERIASGYAFETKRAREDLGVMENQLRDYRERLGQPFQHAAYLTELTRLRDELKAGLAGGEPKEGEPSVAELAERIKAIRASNTVEAAPQRTAAKPVAATEAVTTTIRRREGEWRGA